MSDSAPISLPAIQLLDAAPDAFLVTDSKGSIVSVNRQAESLFGYSRAELLGQDLELLIPERYVAQHPKHRRNYFHSPRIRPMGESLELFARHKSGSEIPVEISLSPVAGDSQTYVASTVRDVSARKLIEQTLRESEERFSMAIAGSQSGVWYWPDIKQDQQWWSPLYFQLLGYVPGELEAAHSTHLSMIHADDLQQVKDALARHFKFREPLSIDYR